jgi:ABC-type transporter Mla MlaB component
MVLSFFKKSEKMPERTAVRPGAQSLSPEEGVASGLGATATATDLNSSIVSTLYAGGDIEVSEGEDGDVFAEMAEHVAISYASRQDAAARATLESLIKGNREPSALKLWGMLFDLLRLQGDRKAFDALGMEFAKVCELSPPSWNMEVEGGQKDAAQAGEAETGYVVLQGALVGDNPLFDDLLQAMSQGQARSLDFGRLVGLDGEAAAKLAKVLNQVRRRGLAWDLVGAAGFAARLGKRAVAGQRQDEPLWLLLLALYQFLGMEAEFEEKALDYAITFEVSPPSWETLKTPPVKTATAGAAEQASQAEKARHAREKNIPGKFGEMAVLEGEIIQSDFKAVKQYLKPGQECYLDFSRVTRLDFASAGALLGLIKSSGCSQVVIYHPNRLVAELMRVAGIDQAARIELSKH